MSCGAAIDKVEERTDRPFGVNLLPNQPDAAERIALIIDSRRPGGQLRCRAPTRSRSRGCNDEGVITIVTVGAKRHAEKVAEMGVRAVIAQGGEGGGHTGTIPTSLLLPQVVGRGGRARRGRARRRRASSTGAAWWLRSPTALTASPWAPGSS